jgi:hypothetical protein
MFYNKFNERGYIPTKEKRRQNTVFRKNIDTDADADTKPS